MKIEVKKDGDNLIVNVEVKHIRGTRRSKREYKTNDVLVQLALKGYDNLKMIKEVRIFNYQTPARCFGTWVFLDLDAVKLKTRFEPVGDSTPATVDESLDVLEPQKIDEAPVVKPKRKYTRRKKKVAVAAVSKEE